MALQLVSPCPCGKYESCPSNEIEEQKTSEKTFIRDLAAYKLTHDESEMNKLRMRFRGATYTVESFIKLKNLRE